MMRSTQCLLCLLLVACLGAFGIAENELDQNDEELSKAEHKLSRANAFFAHRLYKQLCDRAVSFIFSPVSVSIALSMLNVGAGGTTSEQINSTLGFQFARLDEQELLEGYKNLTDCLIGSSDGFQFSLANAQFLQDSFPIDDHYTRRTTDSFNAESRSIDFNNTAEALGVINGWVRNATNGKISYILKYLDPQTVLVLLNAVYFKGAWKNQFNEDNTFETVFTTEEGVEQHIKMMTDDLTAGYNSRHPIGGAVLELPYKGNEFSMIFILPERGQTLDSLERNITANLLWELPNHLNAQTVEIGIPKLKLKYSFNLIPQLKEIGVSEMFTPLANFSGISSEPLHVSQARHRANIEISEEGCEASAATSFAASARSGHSKARFWANRPFMFILRHVSTNTICFMGRVANIRKVPS